MSCHTTALSFRVGSNWFNTLSIKSGCRWLLRPAQGVSDSSGMGKVDGCFDLFDDHFECLIDVVRRVHAGKVLLQGCGVDLVVIDLELSNNVKGTYIPVGNTFGFECAHIYFVYARMDMNIQGLGNVAVQPK